jgi:RND family efflux transporter MFP subunit
LDPVDSVDVRARVSGLIESASFREGSNVKRGDVLFIIDVRPFQADLDSKIAEVAKAKAQLEQATSDFKRIQEAVKTSAVSQRDFDSAKAALDRARLMVESATNASPRGI